MDSAQPPSDSLLDSLAGAVDGDDVVRIVRDRRVAIELGKHAKEAPIRKGVMLLTASDSVVDEECRARRVASLALLWQVKALRPLVEEFSLRMVAESFPSRLVDIPAEDVRLAIGEWLNGLRATWVPEFAAKGAVAPAASEKARHVYLKALFSRSNTISDAIRALDAQATRASETMRSDSAVTQLLRSIAECIAMSERGPGVDLGDALYAFLRGRVMTAEFQASPEPRLSVGLAVAELLPVVLEASPEILGSPSFRELATAISSSWLPSGNRKWLRTKQLLLLTARNQISLLAANGVRAHAQVRALRALETNARASDGILREIGLAHTIENGEIVEWLKNGASETVELGRPRDGGRSELEAIAPIALRVDEVERLVTTDPCLREVAELDSLLGEVRHLCRRKGVQVDSARGAVVPYDPARQQPSRPIGQSAYVRILVPGVIGDSRFGKLQLVKAIVEPVDSE